MKKLIFMCVGMLSLMACGNGEQKTDNVVCDSIPTTEVAPAAVTEVLPVATEVLPATDNGATTDSVK